MDNKIILNTAIFLLTSTSFINCQRQGGRSRGQPRAPPPLPPPPIDDGKSTIGVFFLHDNTDEKFALEMAIERNNRLPDRPKLKLASAELPKSSYEAMPKACQMLQEGVVSIFGPWENHEVASWVQSMCDAFEIPHIETRWDHEVRRGSYMMNLAPHPETIARAIADVVWSLEWTKYLMVYEDQDGLLRLGKLLENSRPPEVQGFIDQLPAGDNYRPWLLGILEAGDFDKIVLDCSPKKVYFVLKHAQEVGMLNSRISFLITNLDFYTVNTQDFKYSRATILALSLIDPTNPEVAATLKLWDQHAVERVPGGADGGHVPLRDESKLWDDLRPKVKSQVSGSKTVKKGQRWRREANGDDDSSEVEEQQGEVFLPGYFTTDIALLFDAVDLLVHALQVVNQTQMIKETSLHCDGSKYWRQGFSIVNQMKTTMFEGLTGIIQFNTTGLRSDFGLDIIQLTSKGISKIGAWDTKFVNKVKWVTLRPGAVLDRPPFVPLTATDILRGKTLYVTTILSAPITMLKLSEEPLEGNDRYEGFSIDLLNELASYLGFTYVFNTVRDGKYGGQNKKGEWNGMVREVMDGVADIAVADLTVNKQRQRAVSFTMPIMTLGISILYVAPTPKPPSLMGFMAPMGVEVWLLLCLAIAGVSVVLHLCARVTSYEWIVSHPCIDEPEEYENDFTLWNCFAFTLGTYLGQGCEVAPKATSTRMLAGFWYLFCLILVSSYTANLAAFLVVQEMDERIKSIHDLPGQTEVKFGCLGGGTTAKFFETSPFYEHVHKQMVEMSKTDNRIFLPSNKEGVERVVQDAGRYAFFMESTVIDYFAERNCKLTRVGDLLDSKAYGIAVKKGSNYSQALNSGILRLQENGFLNEMKRKWWQEERKENACDNEPESSGDGADELALTLANVGGVFLVVFLGCIVAIFISCVELYFSARNAADEKEVPVIDEIKSQLLFALSCRSTVKEIPEADADQLSEGSCDNVSVETAVRVK